jgi:outer membrane receptor protein involved in Fe transport
MSPLTSRFRSIAVNICLALLISALVRAQDPRGTIAGRVVDRSESVVVGAKVQVTNVETKVTTTVQTNDAGTFRVPFLIPGTYQLTAEMAGFKTATLENIELRVADTLDLTVRLDVGATSDKVTVMAGAPVLETGYSTPGTVVDERRVRDLPEKGGDAFELTHYVPGVTNLSTLRTLKPDSPEGTSQISINGTGADQSQWQIDGINDTINDENKGYGRVAYIPPHGAVVEFKLQGNPYDASAGHMLGSVVSVSTKSGTNESHGTMYYYFKNSALDCTDFFINKAGQRNPVSQDHRYGLTIGGPIFAPKLYNGRNKTFFFFAWEENRYISPSGTSGQTNTVPTPAERTGDFSTLLAIGPQYQIYDPFSTVPAANGRYQRQPIPGDILPKSQLNPVGLKLINLYPLPNQAGTIDFQSNNYYPDPRRQSSDSFMVRGDHSFSDNNRFFARLNHYHYTIPKNQLGVPASIFIEDQVNQGIALDDVAVISPSFVLNFRYGLTAAEFPERRASEGTSLTSLGFSPALAALFDSRVSTIPRVSVSPLTTLSNWSLGDGNTSGVTHNLVADATKLKGAHNIRFGADFRLERTYAYRDPAAISPDLSFSTSYTNGPLDNSPSAPVGQAIAAMLLGIPGGSVTIPGTNNYAAQDKYLGLYVQDDFKITPKLTLNLGLRYEMEWPVREKYNRLVAGFDGGTPNPIAAQAIANYARNPIPELPLSAFKVLGGQTFVGSGGSPYNANRGEWLPRLGLAWQLSPQTVLRGGYGIYFGSLGVTSFSPVQTGFTQTTPIQASLDNGQTYIATLTNPFPAGLIAPSGATSGLATALGQSLTVFNPSMKPPYSQRWSFGVQRTLPDQFLLDVSYIGDRVTHLTINQSINNMPAQFLSTSPFRDQNTINFLTATFPNPFYGLNSVYGSTISRATLLEPYPEFGSITIKEPIGSSWYHSLQVKLEKRLSHGYTVQVGYTHSKYMQATEFLNSTDAVPYRTISDMDRPNVFTITGLWELPYGRGRHFGSHAPAPLNFMFGGWQLGMVEVHQSGAPLTWGNYIFLGDIQKIQLPDSQQTVARWFNTSGFNTNSSQQLANNIRTFPIRFSGIRADGATGWNFSMIRNYHVRERIAMQFQAECFNTLNHPVFAAPNTTPTSSAFGTVTNSASEPRSIDFSLKLVF